jgi:hypothetical protein
MPTIRDAKFMAKALEVSLSSRNVALSHGECLDVVARQFGLKDWNVLSAKAKRQEAAAFRRAAALKAWTFRAEASSAYHHGLDGDVDTQGRRSALIRLDADTAARHYPDLARAFGVYVQTVSAVPYQGGKVELQADLRCERVTHGATIWAPVFANPGDMLAFDNLKDASEGWLFGDVPWVRRRIVVDVPSGALSLNFGFFLKGQGALWAADFRVEKASATLPLTASPIEQQGQRAGWITPANLDFSEVIPPASDGRFVEAP